MNEDILIPIAAFAMVTGIVWLVMAHGARNRAELMATIRTAIDKGADLSPEVITALGAPRRNKNGDIKWGVIWVAVALACGVFGAAVSFSQQDPEVFWIFLGIGAFPGFVGAALLGYGLWIGRRPD